MEITIYHYALCVSLTLMVFFSYRFIFGKLPPKESFRPYKISRTLMGAALLMLSANYMVHLFVTPRLTSPSLAIVMNLCTYWVAVLLFGSALMMLLDRKRVTRKRFIRHTVAWIAYCIMTHILWTYVPEGTVHRTIPFFLAVLFLVYAFKVARKVFVTFRKAKRKLDDYYSDDKEAYIRWMSVFTYWAVVFGVLQGVFTFVPDRYVFIWIISAIPFYIYLYVSYANYFIFYEHIEGALATDDSENEAEEDSENGHSDDNGNETDGSSLKTKTVAQVSGMAKAQEQTLDRQIAAWIEQRGFTAGGLTIEDVARETGTNRTYVSSFISNRYGITFREWINGMRLKYAKELMTENPEMAIKEVARRAGYLSLSYFTKTFKETEGITPGKWNRE